MAEKGLRLIIEAFEALEDDVLSETARAEANIFIKKAMKEKDTLHSFLAHRKTTDPLFNIPEFKAIQLRVLYKDGAAQFAFREGKEAFKKQDMAGVLFWGQVEEILHPCPSFSLQ